MITDADRLVMNNHMDKLSKMNKPENEYEKAVAFFTVIFINGRQMSQTEFSKVTKRRTWLRKYRKAIFNIEKIDKTTVLTLKDNL